MILPDFPHGRRPVPFAAFAILLVAGLAAAPGGGPAPATQPAATRPAAVGAFEGHVDVGRAGKPGAAAFDQAKGEYRITGCGENMWKAVDAFQFVYSKASGDVTLTADVRLVGTGGNAHRKAGLIVRQGTEADAIYADVVVHGDGLVALQYRTERGGETKDAKAEAKAPADAPMRLRLQRRGDTLTAFVGAEGGAFREVGSVKLALGGPVYIGLAVCSHDAAVEETAVFTNVAVTDDKVKG